jgi:hypothetical protein
MAKEPHFLKTVTQRQWLILISAGFLYFITGNFLHVFFSQNKIKSEIAYNTEI